MLDATEKRELLEMAASDQLRQEFRRLRAESIPAEMDFDALLSFLSAASRMAPATAHPPTARHYPRALL